MRHWREVAEDEASDLSVVAGFVINNIQLRLPKKQGGWIISMMRHYSWGEVEKQYFKMIWLFWFQLKHGTIMVSDEQISSIIIRCMSRMRRRKAFTPINLSSKNHNPFLKTIPSTNPVTGNLESSPTRKSPSTTYQTQQSPSLSGHPNTAHTNYCAVW